MAAQMIAVKSATSEDASNEPRYWGDSTEVGVYAANHPSKIQFSQPNKLATHTAHEAGPDTGLELPSVYVTTV